MLGAIIVEGPILCNGTRPTIHKIQAGDAHSLISSVKRESSLVHFDTLTSLMCVNETQQGCGNEHTFSSNERKDRENEETSWQELNWMNEKGGRVQQRGWKEAGRVRGGAKRMKNEQRQRKETENLIRLTWAIREHIGHFVWSACQLSTGQPMQHRRWKLSIVGVCTCVCTDDLVYTSLTERQTDKALSISDA